LLSPTQKKNTRPAAPHLPGWRHFLLISQRTFPGRQRRPLSPPCGAAGELQLSRFSALSGLAPARGKKRNGTQKMMIRRRTKILAVVCGSLLFVMALLLVAAPYGIKAALGHWLQGRGAESVEIGDVDFNPFTGRLALRSVRLSGPAGVGVRAASLLFIFDWRSLSQGRLHLLNIEINDGRVALRHEATGEWLLAGISLVHPRVAGETVTDPVRQWGVDEITITNMAMRYDGPQWQEEFTLVSGHLAGLATWERDGAVGYSVELRRDQGGVQLAGDIKPFAAAVTGQGTCRVDNFPVAILAPLLVGRGVEAVQGVISAELTLLVSQGQSGTPPGDDSSPQPVVAGQPFSLGVHGSVVGSAIGFARGGAGLAFSAEAFSLTTDMVVSHSGGDQDGVTVRYQGRAGVDNLRLQATDTGLDLLRAVRLDLVGVQGDQVRVHLASGQAGGLELLQRRPGQSPARTQQDFVAAIGTMAVEGLDLSDQGLVTLEAVRLADVEALVVRNSQGEMEFAAWLQERSPADHQAVDSKKRGGFLCKQVSLTGTNRLVFEDHALPTPFVETFSGLTLTTGSFDSRTPHLKTPVELAGQVGRYASLALAGTISPLAERPTMALKGRLASLDLPAMNPYAHRYLDYHLESGHLDADIVLGVEAGVLDSEIALFLDKLEVTRLNDGRQDPFELITGMPFQYTVDLLRDSQDTIRFRLPVRGDVGNPDFNWNDVLTKATVGAVRKATLSYFTPIGVTLVTGLSLPVGSLYVAGKIFDWAVTLRFQPLVFAPASAAFTEEAQRSLDAMVLLFKERPKVRVVLSGVATRLDLGADHPADQEVSGAERQLLRELAARRTQQVKEYLVGQGIEARRLFISEPKLELRDNESPRVEIGI
jgi:hypothetical protein